MNYSERRAFERQLDAEFNHRLELTKWYVQYRLLKASYADAVLLYRMGDFYETFDDDAKLVAELLDITLTYKKFATERGTDTERRCPMAGMPYHAVERYVSALVAAGYRVAIAEQVSETASSKKDTRPRSIYAAGIEQESPQKGLADRKVVRVVTPGTVVEAGMLPAARNNYLVGVIAEGGRVGLAYADLSTGEFAATEFAGERAAGQAQGELARLEAAEVLTPDDAALRLPGLEPASARLTHDLEFLTKEERELLPPSERVARRTERENTARWAHGHITAWPSWRWELRTARDALLRQFGVQSLAGFGLADRPLATRAAGAVLQYMAEVQNGALAHLQSLRSYTTGDVMFLDPQTRRNLELLEGTGGRARGSLVSVLDQTRTPMGARLLRRWIAQPLLDLQRLRARQDAVAHFVDNALLRATVREQLKQIGDLERAVNRVLQGATIAMPRDLVRLREGLRALPALLAALEGWQPPVEGEFEPGPHAAEAPLHPEPPGPVGAPLANGASHAASLRERREARRSVRPRYNDDDLFGEDEPGAASQGAGAREQEGQVSSRQPPAASPTSQDVSRQSPAAILGARIDSCAEVLAFLETALDDDPPALLGASNYLRAAEENGEKPRRVVRPGFEPEIDRIVLANQKAQRYLSDLERREREATGIKSLRVGYNQVFGYYIEVAKSYADDVPKTYIRKQTLTTGERYITEELKEVERVVLEAQERLVALERQAFQRMCARVAEFGPQLLATARALAALDVYAALADVAVRNRYVRPVLREDTRLEIVAGRHPVVETVLDGGFVPNDATLDTDTQQILLITGPNMAGKSTTLRAVALIVLLAQIGSFVPAERAEIGLVDRIFTRIGAQDDIATGQSTFMVEMTETAALLQQSTRRSLIILDEVGRGTSTYDGMAIARAVVEYIHNEPRLGCRTLFATHYHELTELEGVLPRVRNYHMAAIEQDGRVVFLHELRSGGADRSYGIHVAELAGIPRPVIRRASELLAELENRGQGAPKQGDGKGGRQGDREKEPAGLQAPTSNAQLSLFDIAPSPAIELLRRLNINELTPLEALTKLYELQRLARE
jgi:DNA mismatch repair protein MutS